MRILHITNNYTPYAGGVVSSINATIEALIEAGHQVQLVTFDFGTKHNDPLYVKRVRTFATFRYKKNHMVVPWRMQAQLAQLIKEFKPDLIHLHHPFLLCVAGLRIARQLGIPVLFTHHTQYKAYLHYLPLPSRLLQPFVDKVLFAFCNQVQGIIAPGTSIKHYLEQQISTPVHYIPSALQPHFLQPWRLPPRKELFQLLCVSRFAREKNLFVLLDLIKKINNPTVRLTLAGYGALCSSLQQYAYQTLQFTPDQVVFECKPAKERLCALYAQADLFVFASQTETQGLVVAEAMGGSTPVVALQGPGQSDIIENGYNGYLVNSLDEMANKIAIIQADPALHHRLAQGAHQTASKYSQKQRGAALISLYQAILSAKVQ